MTINVKKVPAALSNIKYSISGNIAINSISGNMLELYNKCIKKSCPENSEAFCASLADMLSSNGINVSAVSLHYFNVDGCFAFSAKCKLDWNDDIAGINGQGLYNPDDSEIVDENPIAFTLSIALTNFINNKLINNKPQINNLKVSAKHTSNKVKEAHKHAGDLLKKINEERFGL